MSKINFTAFMELSHSLVEGAHEELDRFLLVISNIPKFLPWAEYAPNSLWHSSAQSLSGSNPCYFHKPPVQS